MSNRNLETGLDHAKFDLSDSVHRMRRSKSPTEYVIGAFMWCVSNDDHASASLLRSHRRCIDEDDEQTGCRLCRPDPFAGIEEPFTSISESWSEEEAELEVVL